MRKLSKRLEGLQACVRLHGATKVAKGLQIAIKRHAGRRKLAKLAGNARSAGPEALIQQMRRIIRFINVYESNPNMLPRPAASRRVAKELMTIRDKVMTYKGSEYYPIVVQSFRDTVGVVKNWDQELAARRN